MQQHQASAAFASAIATICCWHHSTLAPPADLLAPAPPFGRQQPALFNRRQQQPAAASIVLLLFSSCCQASCCRHQRQSIFFSPLFTNWVCLATIPPKAGPLQLLLLLASRYTSWRRCYFFFCYIYSYWLRDKFSCQGANSRQRQSTTTIANINIYLFNFF